MENYEMLKALYDFQAAHAKTISFEEGEFFILYQSSTKQRNWWPVVNIKGNIGFVPSNYVMKLKVEPKFLITFLDSSIESLKLSKDENINGIIKKDELLQRLIEKKCFIEDYLQTSESSEIQSPDNEQPNTDDTTTNNQNQDETLLEQESLKNSTIDSSSEESKIIQESPSMSVLNIEGVKSPIRKIQQTPDENTSSATNSNNCNTKQHTKSETETTEEENTQLSTVKEQYTTTTTTTTTNENYDDKTEISVIEETIPKDNISVESQDVYRIVDAIRRNTNLSFDLSCEALRVVLSNLEQIFPNAINSYLEAIAMHLTDKLDTPKELLGATHDSKRLQYIFSQLTNCTNDVEQRTWMLYEDEDDIIQFLEELVDILKNADENITSYEMSCDQYQSVVNLVQYYQMESRWRIKRLLLKVFAAACHLDHIAVDILLTSVLTLEIVEDMKRYYNDVESFKELVKVLTVIFSLGQAMPINHQEHLDVEFVKFLFDIIERNESEVLVDMVIALILAFNLQFNDFTQNIVLESMQNLSSARIFTEKILLLLNREEDPVKILKHSVGNSNSVLKMFDDVFSIPETASLFYTNDTKVLIDILVRQLSDLSEGDPMRKCYLELCRKILRNTNYAEHTHRKQDLMKIFTRIFCEETELSANDQQLVRDIANEFPHIFKA